MSMIPVSIPLNDFMQATVTWGGALASAWTEGANRYTTEAARVVSEQGGLKLTKTQQYQIFAREQAKALSNLLDTGYGWADAADAAGKKGIAHIMRKYADKAFNDAQKVLSGWISEKGFLDSLVADANLKIVEANKILTKFGNAFGPVAKVLGPIVDAAQMIWAWRNGEKPVTKLPGRTLPRVSHSAFWQGLSQPSA